MDLETTEVKLWPHNTLLSPTVLLAFRKTTDGAASHQIPHCPFIKIKLYDEYKLFQRSTAKTRYIKCSPLIRFLSHCNQISEIRILVGYFAHQTNSRQEQLQEKGF